MWFCDIPNMQVLANIGVWTTKMKQPFKIIFKWLTQFKYVVNLIFIVDD